MLQKEVVISQLVQAAALQLHNFLLSFLNWHEAPRVGSCTLAPLALVSSSPMQAASQAAIVNSCTAGSAVLKL